MKRNRQGIVWGAALGLGLSLGLGLTGCISFNVERKYATPQPEVVMVPAATADSVACAEIDAAGRLDYDQSRLAALTNIATRTNLSATAQVHLVNTAFKRLDFENSRMALLNTLISNPSFCNAAKQTILTDLNKLSFDHNRATVLASINQRGELKN